MHRLIVTGDRRWRNAALVYDALENVVVNVPNGDLLIVTHGDAEGADKMAGWATRDLQFFYHVLEDPHPAQWYRKSNTGRTFFFKGAGPERNDEMLDLKDPVPSIVLAFHNSLGESKGTRHCVLGAIRRKFLVRIFAEPDQPGFPPFSVCIPPTEGRPEEILQEALNRLRPLVW